MRRWRLSVAVGMLLGLLWLGAAGATVPAGYTFAYSLAPDRSAPKALDGAAMTQQNIYVFVVAPGPSSPAYEGSAVQTVAFSVPRPAGSYTHTEGSAPYDLVGTNGDGTAQPFDLLQQLPVGAVTFTAVVTYVDGGTATLTAAVTVQAGTISCDGCPHTTQTTYQLSGTASHARGVAAVVWAVDGSPGLGSYWTEARLPGGPLQVSPASLDLTFSGATHRALTAALPATAVNWTATVPLALGVNTVRVWAESVAGVWAVTSFRVVRDQPTGVPPSTAPTNLRFQ